MDCQELIMYSLLLLVGIYVVRDMFDMDFQIPLLEAPLLPSSTKPVLAVEGQAEVGAEVVEEPPVAAPPVEAPVVEEKAVVEPSQMVEKKPVSMEVAPSEPSGNEVPSTVKGISSGSQADSCYPQNSLGPSDLLPMGESKQIKEFNEANPVGEGILKGVNYLDAGFNIGVNTVGQSLRNANLNLRAEPPNPRVVVSPWLNTTIDTDLTRKSLDDGDLCSSSPPQGGLVSA